MLVMFVAWTPHDWLSKTCTYVGDYVGGICECSTVLERDVCWSTQLMYRFEAAAFAIFQCMIVLSISGCASQAAHSLPLAKFALLLLLGIILAFVPNSFFDGFGAFAGVVSSAFLVALTVRLIDLAYSWNVLWFAYSREAAMRNPAGKEERLWLIAILVVSTGLLLVAFGTALYLWFAVPGTHARAITLGALLVSLALLLVSITDWCEHGALLTSAAITAYAMWLSYETIDHLPQTADTQRSVVPWWMGLGVTGVILASFTCSVSKSRSKERDSSSGVEMAIVRETASDDGQTSSARELVHEEETVDAWDFGGSCVVHALASLYVTSLLSPAIGWTLFVARLMALIASLVLYGWSLVAPKVLTNRDFG